MHNYPLKRQKRISNFIINQMDMFEEEIEPISIKIEKLQKGLKGLFKRMDDLKKDIEFQEGELEDFIKENI